MDQSSQRHLSRENTRTIFKYVVRQFFIEKEATSALIMDSLYSGLKSVEILHEIKRSGNMMVWIKELPDPIISRSIDKEDTLVLLDDALLLLKRAAKETLPPMHSRNHNKNASAGEDFIISDERRLTELGRRSIEVTVLAHVFRKIELECREWVSLGEQKKLIHGEMEANVRCGTTDKEKTSL